MKRAIVILSFLFLFLSSCSTTENMINPDKPTGDVNLTCMQDVLTNNEFFQKSFKFNKEGPELTIYAKGLYSRLSYEDRDTVLESVGRQWQECYPDDFRPMTLWLKDINDMIITVIFVTKE